MLGTSVRVCVFVCVWPYSATHMYNATMYMKYEDINKEMH